MHPYDQLIDQHRREEQTAGLARQVSRKTHYGIRYQDNGESLVSFCTNDYLGLATDQLLPPTPIPTGGTSSPLVAGYTNLTREVERACAQWTGTDDAVIFASAYQLNLGVLPCLANERTIFHSDQLNHASLIDGLRLGRNETRILPHLEQPSQLEPHLHHWWICETLFSMDGTTANFARVTDHRANGGLTYLDDAHLTGLRQPRDAARLGSQADLIVRAFGKALSTNAAIVCGRQILCDWIRTHARSYVYSTAPGPNVLLPMLQAIKFAQSPEASTRRHRLIENIHRIRETLGALVPASCDSNSPIIPVIVGSPTRSLQLSQRLRRNGWHVQAMRPPTVPDGESRLRITVTAAHTQQEIAAFAHDLERAAS